MNEEKLKVTVSGVYLFIHLAAALVQHPEPQG